MLRLSINTIIQACFATLMLINGVVCLGAAEEQEPGRAKTAESVEAAGEIAGDEALGLSDESAGKEAEEGPMDMDPGFVAAFKSLDESLKYKPEHSFRMRSRLIAAAILGGAMLGLLAVLFGYLKLNHLTRGFYSGRLQTLAIGGAILILALCYFLWTQVLFK